LAERGIASFRFDKRGMHSNRATRPDRDADWDHFFRWEAFTGDAIAAFHRLQATPGIDIGRIGILGHSEGGLVALTAAQVLGRETLPPAALILIATPGRAVASVVREQLALAFLDMKLSPQESETLYSASDEITAAIIRTGTVPAAVPARLSHLYPHYLGAFLRSLFSLDPPAFAFGFSGPVLVVNGAEDRQVSAARDAEGLREALAARPVGAHAVMIAPGAAHDLALAGESAPDKPTVKALVDWVVATVSARQP
jgi:alpha-beta hydrolase superfamily lysophospholipase